MEEITVDPLKCPTITCKCGRLVHVHPETGKAFKHRIGREHQGYAGLRKAKRREMWCPEVS